MRVRTTVLLLVTLFAGVTLCFADDPSLGTWKLNEAKSMLDSGLPKNLTVVYEATGDQVKVTIDGVDAQGKPTHNEWTGKVDGKDYPVTGDPTSDLRSLRRLNEHTLDMTAKKGGKVIMTGRIVIAADGKSRTVSTSATSPAGKKIHSTSVYDKQ